jgi:hypothetical protein
VASGRPSVPAARPGAVLGDAVAVLVHGPQVVHGGGAAGRRGFLEPVTRLDVSFGNPLLPRPGRFWLASVGGTGRSGEPVRGEVRSGQTEARPFRGALRPGFAGLGFLGFLVAKQSLPKRGRRLGSVGRAGSVTMPPSRLGPGGGPG